MNASESPGSKAKVRLEMLKLIRLTSQRVWNFWLGFYMVTLLSKFGDKLVNLVMATGPKALSGRALLKDM